MTENNQVVDLNFEVAYRDIQVGDEIVRLRLSDEVRTNFAFDIKEAFGKIEKLSQTDKDFKNQTREEAKAQTEQLKSYMREAYDGSLGEGTFDRVYEAAGQSTPNCLQFMAVCLDIIHEFDQKVAKDVQTRKANKYLKNKKAQQKTK